MSQLCVPIPPIDQTRTIDVEVVIDGAKQRVQYRVETLEWPDDNASRAEALRAFIASHGEDWLLVQIGTPTAERVPVMFRLRAQQDTAVPE
ncbi:MAG: hypothetical protein AAGI91_04235 [Bacteroidota bacterium]